MIKRPGLGGDRDPIVRGKNDGKIANGSQFLCVLRGKTGNRRRLKGRKPSVLRKGCGEKEGRCEAVILGE